MKRQDTTESIINFLLKYGAMFVSAIKDKYGKTALHNAARSGDNEAVEMLLANGANINVRDKFGRTALHEALYCGKQATADLLIAKGIDVNAKDQEGYTAEARMKWLDSMREEDRRQHETTVARIKAGNA